MGGPLRDVTEVKKSRSGHLGSLNGVNYRTYAGEADQDGVKRLLAAELTEPYSNWVYRYFLTQWPHLCLLAFDETSAAMIGVVVCKMEERPNGLVRGYIGMLAVDPAQRRRGIASELVRMVIEQMRADGCNEVSLETEVSNSVALAFYDRFGFFRSKLLLRYYSAGTDAYRLKLPVQSSA